MYRFLYLIALIFLMGVLFTLPPWGQLIVDNSGRSSDSVFFAKCRSLNFTQAQCEFFRYGPKGASK